MVMGLERLERITAFIDEAAEAGIGDMAAPEPQESEDSYQDAAESKPQMLSQRSGQLPQKISVEQQVGSCMRSGSMHKSAQCLVRFSLFLCYLTYISIKSGTSGASRNISPPAAFCWLQR